MKLELACYNQLPTVTNCDQLLPPQVHLTVSVLFSHVSAVSQVSSTEAAGRGTVHAFLAHRPRVSWAVRRSELSRLLIVPLHSWTVRIVRKSTSLSFQAGTEKAA